MLSGFLFTARALLADCTVVIAFLVASVYRPHADTYREGTVTAAVYGCGRTRAESLEPKILSSTYCGRPRYGLTEDSRLNRSEGGLTVGY